MRILLVEDEINLAMAIKELLKKQNYTIDVCHDGESGLDNILSDIYDLIILDIMLPKMDGISILNEVRKSNIKVPIIMLTAKSTLNDKISGLDHGADDYLTKPFETEELMARIRALSRRKEKLLIDNDIKFGDLKLVTETLTLSTTQREIKITLKEKELLELLITRVGMVSSKSLIIEKLWGYDSDADDNHVEVYISFLRKKLVFLDSIVKINTVRGLGYILEK